MSIALVANLGPYEILSPIGAGGMGEVYRAKDTRLDREVAIKVLPDALSRDPERLQRFQREAKVLASLNHPNIAAIYGFEEADGQSFLVMELVEGVTLGQRLNAGPMPVEEALSVGKQIAEALEAAHECGVIHRDLKPANVKVTPDGKVKVLDFGLAKAMATVEDRSQTEIGNSPTITANFTRAGVILGTAAYMSPEQARGRPLDKRTDIWSFGCVLYECLGGRRPFDGETTTDMIARILERAPDWNALPQNTPPIVRALLQRCLQKDRKDRLRDIGEAWVALNGAITGDVSGITLAGEERDRSVPAWRRALPWAVAVAASVALGLFWLSARPVERPVMRLTFSIPEDETLAAPRWPMFDISPDGTRVVYVGRGASDHQLYLRHIHQLEAAPLPNTTGAHTPFFSPDGEWIAFAQQGKLRKISVLGGPAVTICEAPHMRGGTWGTDGTIVFAPEIRSGIWRVPSAGGEPEKLTDAGTGEKDPSHRWPHFLPDGKTVVFTATSDNNNYDEADIVALSLDTMEQKAVLHGGTFAHYAPTGHLLFTRLGTLMAVPFDPAALEATEQPVPVLEGVFGVGPMGSAQYAFSQGGALVYLAGATGAAEESIVWVDRNGQESPLSAHSRDYSHTRISPDGAKLAVQILDGTRPDIWILEIERDMLTRLTFHDNGDMDPVWSPDGEWIAFASDREGGVPNLYRRRADGTGDVERLTTSENRQFPRAFSPDGSLLVFMEARQNTQADIMLLHLDDDARRMEPLWATPFEEFHPSVSPDGKWLAYTSNESGQYEVYVQPFPGGGRRVKISVGMSFDPRWSPDGSELYYRPGGGSGLMVVPVSVSDGTFRAEAPQVLFEKTRGAYAFWYDVAPDGKQFVFGRNPREDDEQFRQPTVVVNWFDELTAKVPTGEGR